LGSFWALILENGVLGCHPKICTASCIGSAAVSVSTQVFGADLPVLVQMQDMTNTLGRLSARKNPDVPNNDASSQRVAGTTRKKLTVPDHEGKTMPRPFASCLPSTCTLQTRDAHHGKGGPMAGEPGKRSVPTLQLAPQATSGRTPLDCPGLFRTPLNPGASKCVQRRLTAGASLEQTKTPAAPSGAANTNGSGPTPSAAQAHRPGEVHDPRWAYQASTHRTIGNPKPLAPGFP